MKTIAFFNNKGGVGKTSLVYHLAWMFADHGIKTLAVDGGGSQSNFLMQFQADLLNTKILKSNDRPQPSNRALFGTNKTNGCTKGREKRKGEEREEGLTATN